jgi:predicted CoA-binding protein
MTPEHRLLEDDDQIRNLLTDTRRVAVLGIRSEAFAERPAFYVPHYIDDVGYEVIPVPVVEPKVTEILGHKTYRSLTDIPGDIDLVQVFRKAEDIPAHVGDILVKRPKAVWFQEGIRNDDAAIRFAEAGIEVVQDRCMMVEHRRLMR